MGGGNGMRTIRKKAMAMAMAMACHEHNTIYTYIHTYIHRYGCIPAAHHYHDHDHHHHQMVWVGDESRLPGSQKAKAEKQKQQNWWSSDHEK